MSRRYVRLRHRETGVEATAEGDHGTRMSVIRRDALRLLRARLWQRRHRIGPQPIVRSYDLTGDDSAAVSAMLDGDVAFGSAR